MIMFKNFSDFLFRRKIVLIIFILGLIYVGLPGAQTINDFPGLSPSTKSNLPGDTWQNPNIAAYFSDYRREDITNYYKEIFSKKILWGIPLPIISLNHPPEMAYQYVRDQQESTFLEEYVFPMRESIFVNGYDPKIENDRYHDRDRSFIGDHTQYKKVFYNTKTTLRFYPSNIFLRILVYLGIWVAIFGIKEVLVKLIKQK